MTRYDVRVKSPFRIRPDLQRVTMDGFAYPLGVEVAPARPSREGYCMTWVEAEGDGPDTYTFLVVVSHERLKSLLTACFSLLPEQVAGIMEVGSRDAFRAVDVFLGASTVSIDRFRATWNRYEAIFLEDASLAVGVNTESPFMEVFLDQDKRVTIHVEPGAREDIESMLMKQGLKECDEQELMVAESELERTVVRPVMLDDPSLLCDVDQLLLALRHELELVLDEDQDRNLDASGRDLGRTLWHAIVLLEACGGIADGQAHAMAWVVCGSRNEVESLLRERIEDDTDWSFSEFYTLDRVAFDDRPEALVDLAPRHPRSEIFMLEVESLESDAGE
ncbi:MAG: hypothetical protein P8M22_06495 [Phycisphaerales bacterium]|nr:hypothetical protein [Phycisphaerales bacterium]